MRAAPFFIRSLDRTCASKLAQHAKVPLMAPGLSVDPIRLVALHLELLDDGPRSCPHRRIIHRDDYLERLRTGAGPTFDEMQILSRPLKIGLVTEVCDVNDQRLALPMRTRVPPPLTDIGR